MFPTQECGKHCMQSACIHTTCSEYNISDLAILLRGWNFASGSMAVDSCIVTSCLLTKWNLIAKHNSHVWEDKNPHTTVESNFQLHFSVNVWCAVLYEELIDPVVLVGLLTGKVYLRFLQEELPRLLEDVPLNKRG